jgi:hypothetical protein
LHLYDIGRTSQLSRSDAQPGNPAGFSLSSPPLHAPAPAESHTVTHKEVASPDLG